MPENSGTGKSTLTSTSVSFEMAILVAIEISGVLLNSSVLTVIYFRYKYLPDKRRYLLLLNILICDIILLIFIIPASIGAISHTEPGHCITFATLFQLCFVCSFVSQALLSVMMVIQVTVSTCRFLSRGYYWLAVIFSWMVSLLFTLMLVFPKSTGAEFVSFYDYVVCSISESANCIYSICLMLFIHAIVAPLIPGSYFYLALTTHNLKSRLGSDGHLPRFLLRRGTVSPHIIKDMDISSGCSAVVCGVSGIDPNLQHEKHVSDDLTLPTISDGNLEDIDSLTPLRMSMNQLQRRTSPDFLSKSSNPSSISSCSTKENGQTPKLALKNNEALAPTQAAHQHVAFENDRHKVGGFHSCNNVSSLVNLPSSITCLKTYTVDKSVQTSLIYTTSTFDSFSSSSSLSVISDEKGSGRCGTRLSNASQCSIEHHAKQPSGGRRYFRDGTGDGIWLPFRKNRVGSGGGRRGGTPPRKDKEKKKSSLKSPFEALSSELNDSELKSESTKILSCLSETVFRTLFQQTHPRNPSPLVAGVRVLCSYGLVLTGLLYGTSLPLTLLIFCPKIDFPWLYHRIAILLYYTTCVWHPIFYFFMSASFRRQVSVATNGD